MVNKMHFRAVVLLILLLLAVSLLSGTGNSKAITRAAGDLDGDGKAEEYSLIANTLSVSEGEKDIWKSLPDYRVDSFVLEDVDNNGTVNLVISLWKKGSFGEMRPFWHSGKDADYKNHLFVYKLQENTFQPVWCSSELDCPILSFTIRDINGDGRNELVVEEGQYKKVSGAMYAPDPDGIVRTTVWQWEEWGFVLRSGAGIIAAR